MGAGSWDCMGKMVALKCHRQAEHGYIIEKYSKL